MGDEVPPAHERYGRTPMDFQPGERFVEYAAKGQSSFRVLWQLWVKQPPLQVDDLTETLDLSTGDRQGAQCERSVLPSWQEPSWDYE